MGRVTKQNQNHQSQEPRTEKAPVSLSSSGPRVLLPCQPLPRPVVTPTRESPPSSHRPSPRTAQHAGRPDRRVRPAASLASLLRRQELGSAKDWWCWKEAHGAALESSIELSPGSRTALDPVPIRPLRTAMDAGRGQQGRGRKGSPTPLTGSRLLPGHSLALAAGKPETFAVGPSPLLAQLQSFLPKMDEANVQLAQKIAAGRGEEVQLDAGLDAQEAEDGEVRERRAGEGLRSGAVEISFAIGEIADESKFSAVQLACADGADGVDGGARSVSAQGRGTKDGEGGKRRPLIEEVCEGTRDTSAER